MPAQPDYQVQISKDGSLRIVNPDTSQTLVSVPFAGVIMKGCKSGALAQIADVGTGISRTVRSFDTLFSFGHFSSPSIPGVLSMQQNPIYSDSGYEVQLVPGQEFPKRQFWSMYGIFTVDLSGLDPNFSRFQLANREETPIRLSVDLDRPWGEEPLQYRMQDELVPLYAWDAAAFDFAATCPLTGSDNPQPIAFIERSADSTNMTAAWARVNGTLAKTL